MIVDQHVANADSVAFLQDIEVMDINESSKPRREQHSRDIDALFSAPYLKDGKKYRDCHACSKSHKCAVSFVNEVTTLRRHQEAAHRGDYLEWAKNNDFISMLPRDAKQRREQAAADQQPSISGHLKPRAPDEHVYKERYLEIHGDGADKTLADLRVRTASTGNLKLDALLGELSDGEEDVTPQHTPSALSRTSSTSLLDTVDPLKSWLHDFHAYLNSKDHLGDMTVVQWWGINSPRYPVCASLARDFLSVMATSVSSERAFSSAGITISKRGNRLKADIVEALQCL
ncbi:hypothetical protein AZE42_01727, partial [Rhizopogon vesiculosus]